MIYLDILNISTVGFLVVFLGTLLLFGEFLVKVKGIFGLIGVGIIATYFSHHLSEGMGMWVAILFIVGVFLIIIDGKFITDGTVALFGLLLMIIGLAIPAPNIIYGFLVAMGALLGTASSILFLKVFPSRNMWEKITLKEQLSSDRGYNSMNQTYSTLIGKVGVTKTPFRPTGTVEVDGHLYSATTDNQWLTEGVDVTVVSVDGTRILIKKIEV